MKYADFIAALDHELTRARTKFPHQTDKYVTLAALTEEVGETAQAVLQSDFEGGRKTAADIRKEAVQVACMAVRLACDAFLG